MTLHRILAATALAATIGTASIGAHATIVNINATTPVGPSLLLGAGSYTVTWAGIAGGGLYDAWQYNNATSGNFRETFTVALGGAVYTFDRNDGNHAFNNYATAAAALSDVQNASGPNQFVQYSTNDDSSLTGSQNSPFTFTLDGPTLLAFSVPDYIFTDNKGGVSLSITAAVPEPETYALMLAGLGAIGFMARRRKATAI